jgi:hypothetical protein
MHQQDCFSRFSFHHQETCCGQTPPGRLGLRLDPKGRECAYVVRVADRPALALVMLACGPIDMKLPYETAVLPT